MRIFILIFVFLLLLYPIYFILKKIYTLYEVSRDKDVSNEDIEELKINKKRILNNLNENEKKLEMLKKKNNKLKGFLKNE